MFQDAKLLWRSYDDLRELIIRYYSEHELPRRCGRQLACCA